MFIQSVSSVFDVIQCDKTTKPGFLLTNATLISIAWECAVIIIREWIHRPRAVIKSEIKC